MNENLIKLAEKLNTNPEYQKKLLECKNKEEIFNYCTSICGGYTKEELEKFILGILSVQKFNKTPISDSQLKSISGGEGGRIQVGTVNQISDKLDTISSFQGVLLNFSKIFNKVYFMDDINSLSPQEMMQLTMSIANSFGMN